MAQVKIHKDGSVEALIGTQEIGGGERTVVWLVASAALGYLPLGRIRVSIGDSDLPRSGASGGSSTTMQVSLEVKAAASHALDKLFDLVAKETNEAAGALQVKSGGEVWSKEGGKLMSWDEACKLIPDVLIGLVPSPLVPPDRWYITNEKGEVVRQAGQDKYVS